MPRKFKLEFECENDAFATLPAMETANVINRLASMIGASGYFNAKEEGTIYDRDGNKIGKWSYGEEA